MNFIITIIIVSKKNKVETFSRYLRDIFQNQVKKCIGKILKRVK